MTLEEAKKEIAKRKAMNDSVVYRIKEPWNPARTFYKGVSSGLGEAIALLEGPDTEPVGNPDKLTLTELAHELRRLFEFNYLTAEPVNENGIEIGVWNGIPDIMDGYAWTNNEDAHCCMSFFACDMCVGLDLSEYADENGAIVYSKCIVEVE